MKLNKTTKKDYLLERICYYSRINININKLIYICVFSLQLKLNEVNKLKILLKKKNIKLIGLKGNLVRNFSYFGLGFKNLLGGKLWLVIPVASNIMFEKGILPVFFILNGIVCVYNDAIRKENDLVDIMLDIVFDFSCFIFIYVDLINIIINITEYLKWQL